MAEGQYKKQTPYEEKVVADTLQEFSQMSTWRATFATHWEEVAELIDPPSRNTFFPSNYNTPGTKKTDKQIDATGMMALQRFAAILDSLLTPKNMKWHGLTASNEYVMKDRATKLWFEDTTHKLFKYRYSAMANFSAQNYSNWKAIGAFGTGGVFVDAIDTRFSNGQRGLRYKALPLGELFLRENHQGLVDSFIRYFRLTARQALQKWPDTFPEILRPALDQKSEMTYPFLHRVCPREDYDQEKLTEKGMPFASYYVSMDGKCLLQEGGYQSFPLAASRYEQTPGEIYGRSPAMMVLPALKTLNAEKRVFLKQGHRAADPVLLSADDGLTNMSLRPGAMNPGGVTADGKPLVHVLPTGRIGISKEMMQEEAKLINDAFLVTLFQILVETPAMSATEVLERINEKSILLAPTVGRQESEYLGVMIPREVDVLGQQGLLLPMPPALKEARGEYEVVYTSPLSRMMRAQEASGFWRTFDQAKDAFSVSQDPSVFDTFDLDTAIPATAEINGTLPSWMNSGDKIGKMRQMRQKQREIETKIQAAPAEAALQNAQTKRMQVTGPPQPGQAQGPPAQ